MAGADEIRFTIPGRVAGKGRARFARVGKFVRTFTPEKTANAEAMVRSFGEDAMTGRPLMEGPIHMAIIVSLERPASWSKKKVAASTYPTGKPDLDNVAKLIGDALNGVVWKDDSQIASLQIARQFVTDGECVQVLIRPMAGNWAVAA